MNNLNDKLINEWESCIGNQRLNLIEKCLKLAQIIEYPNLDISNEVQKLNNLGVMLKNSITENKNQTYLISLLNEFIFQKCGFYGDLEILLKLKILFVHQHLLKQLPFQVKDHINQVLRLII